jgi:putative ABC transport system substrate-binding protein
MRRRDFVALVGGAATWSLAARAQPAAELRRIGVLNLLGETDSESQAWDAVLRKRLGELGWIEGSTVRITHFWGDGTADRVKVLAKELVRLHPEVIVSITTPATAALKAETQTIPIVFAHVSDPVGSGLVASFAKPGGNVTGFVNLEASLSGKWLELMRTIAPSVSRVAFRSIHRPHPSPTTIWRHSGPPRLRQGSRRPKLPFTALRTSKPSSPSSAAKVAPD